MTPPSGRSAGLVALVLLAACASSGSVAAPTTPADVAVTTTVTPLTTPPVTTTPVTASVTTPPASSTTTPGPTQSVAPAVGAGSVRHAIPVVSERTPGYAREHHDYPAADLFGGCGDRVVSPVDGTIVQLQRTNLWDDVVDDPATRGGHYISIVGDDGVRYYLAHLASIDDGIDVGTPVRAGDPLGVVGDTGRASACHLHFGISPPCENDEWWVRRGVVWPWPYLDAWRTGFDVSPIDETTAFTADHPGVCTDQTALPWNSR